MGTSWQIRKHVSFSFILWLVLSSMARSTTSLATTSTRIAIVGSGPAGLQLAHYLKSSNISFVLIDADEPGAFFTRFPRHRQLISINKRVAPSRHLDFALRHDWNSLLSDPSHLSEPTLAIDAWSELNTPFAHPRVSEVSNSTLFQHYTRDFFPDAGFMSRYLSDFRDRLNLTAPGQSGRVGLFGWRVQRVQRLPGGSESAPNGFQLSLESSMGSLTSVIARRIVVATGLSKPSPLRLATGQELVDTYASAPVDPMAYENQRVLIVGRGNAAFELASVALQTASVVQIAGGIGGRIRPSWETHYPGDVRLTHAQLLETYLLKSGDGLIEVDMSVLGVQRGPHGGLHVVEVPAVAADGVPSGASADHGVEGGPIDDGEEADEDNDADDETGDDNNEEDDDAVAEEDDATMESTHNASLVGGVTTQPVRLTWDPEAAFAREANSSMVAAAPQQGEPEAAVWAAPAPGPTPLLGAQPAPALQAEEGGHVEEDALWSKREYDRVVVCTGWDFDDSWLPGDVRPARSAVAKFPAVTARYESVNVPGLFFAGALAHSLDWKRSAGGFIHGFRYTARALHRILVADEATADAAAAIPARQPLRGPLQALREPRKVPAAMWPTTEHDGVGSVARALLHRMSTSSGLYQMFGALCDVVLLPPPWELRRALHARAAADRARGLNAHPARRALPLLRRPKLPLPAQGPGWDPREAERLLNAALPATRMLLATEVPVGLAPLLARRLALAAWTNATEAHWSVTPADLASFSPGDAGTPAGSETPSAVSALLAAARRQAVSAWSGPLADRLPTPAEVAGRGLSMYRPVPAAPLAAEEAWLDAQWEQHLEPGAGLPSQQSRGGALHGCAGPFWPPAICYLTMTLEYGHDHEVPGTDPFSAQRGVTRAAEAASSQFLHPVLRLWRVTGGADPREVLRARLGGISAPSGHRLQGVPNATRASLAEGPWRRLDANTPLTATAAVWTRDGSRPAASDIAGKPAAVFESHVMEDFLTEFDQPYHMEAAAYALKRALWMLPD